MKDIKRFLALFIALCLTCTCVLTAWAETGYSESELTDEQIEEYPDYVEGNVIVCVKGGAAALNAALSGDSGESRQRKMLKKSVRDYVIDEVLASFDTQPEAEVAAQSEAEAEPESAPEAEPAPAAQPERPLLFSALKPVTAPADTVDDSKEDILLLHADDTEKLIAKLEALPCVVYAQPDYIYEPETLEASDYGTKEPYFFAQNSLENKDGGRDMDAAEAWEAAASADLETQVVAVMDSGVNYTHPDLAPVMWNEGLNYPELKALGGGAYGINTSGEGDKDDPDDTFVGHGTHCASIIASAWNKEGTAGVGSNIRIMACRWLGIAGGKTSSYVKAANYVIKAKEAGVNVTVANNSWGASARFLYQSPVQNDIAVRMGEAGIANVFAASNDSRNLDAYQQNTHIRTDTTLIVGASDSSGGCAVFSNYGKKNVDVMAPGVHILAAATLSPQNMSLPPQYLPWLDSTESIMFCNMEDVDKICVKAGQSKEIEYPEDATPSNATTSNATPSNATPSNATPSNSDQEDDDSKMPGILPEIATPSVVTKQLYGKSDNKAIAFETKYKSGENNGFDVELKLTDEQAKKAAGAGTVYIAFQIARDGDMSEPDLIRIQPMIWNNASGKFAYLGDPKAIFIDPQWNPVSFSFSTNDHPKFVDEEGRIRLRFMYDEWAELDGTGRVYMDNVGISLKPSEYVYSSGTSMACPNAAAVLAMIIGKLQAEDSTHKKTDVEIIKEAIAYVKGGAVKNNALSGKCITGAMVNAARSLKGEVSPVIDELEDQGNGTSIISGYFFGNNAGTVTIGGKAVNVVSWSDRAIQIENIDIERSRAEIIVTNQSGDYGRGYADYGDASEGYRMLAPLPVIAADAKLCAAGDTILCFACEDDGSGQMQVGVWKYDLNSDTWSRVKTPGDAIANFLGAAYEVPVAAGETEIYFLSTMYEGSFDQPETLIDKGRLLTYDTVTDTWKYDVKVDVRSCTYGTMCVYNGELVLFGVDEQKPLLRKIYPDTGEVYETIEGFPEEYCSGYSFQVGEDILAAGMVNGMMNVILDGMLPGMGKYQEILRYEKSTGTWNPGKAVFFGDDSEWLDEDSWKQCSAVPLKDGLMIVGPVKNNGEKGMTDTWIYKASEDTYEAYPAAFDTMRTKNVASCLLDGKMYVLGITSMEEKNGNMRFSVLDISEIAGGAYPNAKKSPAKPDPKPKHRSGGYDPLWSNKPVKTGTPGDPVSDGVWTRNYNGVWYYHTNAYFRNTWGYILNPYAGAGQHQADWFWFDEYGKMLTGWQFIGGKWYYLNPDKDGTLGACFMGPGRTPDGYEVDASGAWTGR